MRRILFIFPLLFTGCTSGISLKSVNYDHLFNDSNSKVWVVNKELKSNMVVSDLRMENKKLLIFHSNYTFNIIPMKELARKEPLRGDYDLNSQKRTLSMYFDTDEEWLFDIAYLTEDSILLLPNAEATNELSLQLKPFPEL